MAVVGGRMLGVWVPPGALKVCSVYAVIKTHKRFKRVLFIKRQHAHFVGWSPLSSYKMTLKQQLNSEIWGGELICLSVFGWAMLSAGKNILLDAVFLGDFWTSCSAIVFWSELCPRQEVGQRGVIPAEQGHKPVLSGSSWPLPADARLLPQVWTGNLHLWHVRRVQRWWWEVRFWQ